MNTLEESASRIEGPEKPGRQRQLKHALLRAYHTEGRNPGAKDVLLELATEAGLDADAAREVIESGAYTDEVRQAEAFWRDNGINAVPSIIFDQHWMLQGAQPPEQFERAIRAIITGAARGIGRATLHRARDVTVVSGRPAHESSDPLTVSSGR